MNKGTISAGRLVFSYEAEDNAGQVNIAFLGTEEGVELYEIRLGFIKAGEPSRTRIVWHEHMLGLCSFWCPSSRRDHAMRQWYAPRVNESRIYYCAPVMSVYNNGGANFRTVAVSEAEKPVAMSVSVNDFDEKEELDFDLRLFEKTVPDSEEFSLILRIDTRDIPYTDCVADTAVWWRGFYPDGRTTGGTCDRPLYSNWYSFHQNPQQDRLTREVDIAAELGFKSLIIDDGWSYDGPGTGDYYNCGSWDAVKSKFPDMKAFVRHAHEKGIKVAVWFAVPFIGKNDPEFPMYEDKLLYYADNFRAGVLDPRRKDVRDYIIGTYRRVVEDYDLDGLKLDFIDSFLTEKAAPCPEGDCATVEEAIDRLLRDIDAEFRGKDPDFMMEFRQHYEGPSIIRRCNMLRVGDCPFDTLTNRVGIVDLRIYNYPLAAHADMFYWSHDEKPEVCARMMLSTLFGVPQISVLLQNSTPEQLSAIKEYIRYWDAHRELLLHSRIHVTDPECNYTTVTAHDDDMRITAVYAQRPVAFDGLAHDVFNASDDGMIFVNASEPFTARVYDCFGSSVSGAAYPAGAYALAVPTGGRAELRR